jgi:hypothetical protein
LFILNPLLINKALQAQFILSSHPKLFSKDPDGGDLLCLYGARSGIREVNAEILSNTGIRIFGKLGEVAMGPVQ